MDEDGAVYYRWGMDVEGSTASPTQFRNLVVGASASFDEPRCAAIGAAAFTVRSGEKIIGDYVKARGPDSSSVPRILQ